MRLKRPSRVDLCYDYLCTQAVGHLCKAASAVAVTCNNKPLSADEGVRRNHHRGKSAFAGPVDVVKRSLHRGIVDGDYREFELSLCGHCTEPVDTGRRLFAASGYPVEKIASLRVEAMDQVHAVVDCDSRVCIQNPVDRIVVVVYLACPLRIAFNARDVV